MYLVTLHEYKILGLLVMVVKGVTRRMNLVPVSRHRGRGLPAHMSDSRNIRKGLNLSVND